MDRGRPLLRRSAGAGRPGARRRARGKRGGRAAVDQRLAQRRASSSMLLARISGARRILEIGTLGGYSTIWLARALAARRPPHQRSRRTPNTPRSPAPISSAPGSPTRSRCASGARSTPARARRRRPRRLRPLLHRRRQARAIADYLEWSLKLSRRGSVIIADNVVRDGAVADRRDAPTRTSTACAASTSSSPPNPRVTATADPDRRRKRLRRLRHRPGDLRETHRLRDGAQEGSSSLPSTFPQAPTPSW